MNKKEARELLDINQTKLAEVLCVSKSHLSRMKDLSASHVKIVQGELAKVILKDAVKTIERLETENEALRKKMGEIIEAAKSLDPNIH